MSKGAKGEVDVGSADGWARVALLGMSRDDPNEVAESGVCVAREGLESRRTLRDSE